MISSRLKLSVTVAIVTRNMSQALTDCLESLLGQYYPQHKIEIIVVDNASTDQTLFRLQDFARRTKNLKVITRETPDVGAAKNAALRAAEGEIIAFLEPDCVAQPEWLERLTRPFIFEETVLGVEGRLLPEDERRITPLHSFVDNRSGGFYWTANMAYRTAAIRHVGGFDEAYPDSPGQDADLATRVKSRGTLVFEAEAVVRRQFQPATLLQSFRSNRGFSSLIRMARKYPGLLTPADSGFSYLMLYYMRYLFFQMLSQAGWLFRSPVHYAAFWLTRAALAVDACTNFLKYYRLYFDPFEVREPFRRPEAPELDASRRQRQAAMLEAPKDRPRAVLPSQAAGLAPQPAAFTDPLPPQRQPLEETAVALSSSYLPATNFPRLNPAIQSAVPASPSAPVTAAPFPEAAPAAAPGPAAPIPRETARLAIPVRPDLDYPQSFAELRELAENLSIAPPQAPAGPRQG